MALVFGDSFDHYLIADILKKWTSSGGSVTDTNIAPAYALPPHAAGLIMGGNAVGYYEKTLLAALTTFVCGTWFRTGSLANASLILAFMDSATPANIHVSVRYDTSGHITLCRDATVLATSTNVLAINTWYHIEVKATIDDSTGAYEVKVDGTSVNWIPAATNKDTRNAGNASIGSVRIYSRNANDLGGVTNHRFQDFYVLDTTGAVANDFIGPCRFAIIRPVGVGNSAQWTGNYADNFANVADQQGDGDTTFNQDATAGHIDLFTMTNVPTGTIHAIQHVLMARKDAGAARTIRPKTRIGGTNYDGATVSLAATYVFVTEPVSVSPATTAAWDDAEIDGAEFGYELVS